MTNTGLRDMNGKELFVGDYVLIEGEPYEVIINDFNGEFAVDSDLGQTWLKNVTGICYKIEMPNSEED